MWCYISQIMQKEMLFLKLVSLKNIINDDIEHLIMCHYYFHHLEFLCKNCLILLLLGKSIFDYYF